MLLIGSHAINHYIPGFRAKPGDVDVIASPIEIEDLINRGFTPKQHTGSNTALISPSGQIWDIEEESDLTREIWGECGILIGNVGVDIPSLDFLYTLKLSHRYRKDSPHFMKTMLDIHTLRKAGVKVFSDTWLRERERITYGYSKPNLLRTKEEFFRGDSVEYIYDHDSIHQAVKLGDVPAYTRFGTPGQDVLSSRFRFNALSEEHRLHAVLEETYVLAMERSQIPFPGTSPHVSFKIALEKVCSSITSGWFREYAWENYFIAVMMYSPAYVDRFNAALAAGVVKPYVATPAAMINY